MTDFTPHPSDESESGAVTPRRGPDLFTLAVGLATLAVALSVLLGGTGWLPEIDLRWVLAGVAILVGLALVIGSIRPRRS